MKFKYVGPQTECKGLLFEVLPQNLKPLPLTETDDRPVLVHNAIQGPCFLWIGDEKEFRTCFKPAK